MKFLFASEDEFESKALGQGDLLIRTQAVSSALAEAHNYYATAGSYTHFVVVTQSCDLVRRANKPPKAPYITIAAVRPAQILIDRYMSKLAFKWQGSEDVGIYDADKKELASQFLERLINNEEKNYFFFKAESHPSVIVDMCAFLPLSVAMKSTHYDTLLSAKVAQLDPIFSAKLGWLVGNMYSRIATPDLEEEGQKELKEEFLRDRLGEAWLSGPRWRELGKRLKDRRKENSEFVMSRSNVMNELEKVPSDMELLARRAVEIAKSARIVTEETDEIELFNRLSNDANLRSLAKGVR